MADLREAARAVVVSYDEHRAWRTVAEDIDALRAALTAPPVTEGYGALVPRLTAERDAEREAREQAESEQCLPDCMMPDGAEPCIAYRNLEAKLERLRADDFSQTTDAALWAAAFVSRFGGDEGLMLAWFANAIERGRTAGETELAAEREARERAEKERDAVIEETHRWKEALGTERSICGHAISERDTLRARVKELEAENHRLEQDRGVLRYREQQRTRDRDEALNDALRARDERDATQRRAEAAEAKVERLREALEHIAALERDFMSDPLLHAGVDDDKARVARQALEGDSDG